MSTIDHGYRYGLVRGKQAVSKLIGRDTRSDKTHGLFLTPRGRILESVAGDGMRERDISPDDLETTDFFDVEGRTLSQWRQMEDIMRGWVRDKIKYDYAGIWKWLVRRPMHVNKRLFCTEALELASKMVGDPLFRCEAHYVSPRDHDINMRLIPRKP